MSVKSTVTFSRFTNPLAAHPLLFIEWLPDIHQANLLKKPFRNIFPFLTDPQNFLKNDEFARYIKPSTHFEDFLAFLKTALK